MLISEKNKIQAMLTMKIKPQLHNKMKDDQSHASNF